MKNLNFYLFVGIGLFFMMSCTNNDDETNFASDVEGEWQLTRLESINLHDFNNDGEATNNLMLEVNCYLNETIIFNPDNTAISKNTSYTEIIAMLIPGTTNSYNYAAGCISEESLISFNWSTDGSNIIIIDNVDADTQVLPVNNNQFSFVSDNALMVKKSDDNSVLIEEDLKFTYTKN